MSQPWSSTQLALPQEVMGAGPCAESGCELAWLDGASGDSSNAPHSRFSLLASEPVAIIEQAAGGPAQLHARGQVLMSDRSAWSVWRAALDRLGRTPPAPTPLAPGWIGYVGFEAAALLEARVPARGGPQPLPLFRLALFDAAVVLDALTGSAQFVVCAGVREKLGLPPRSSADDRRQLAHLRPSSATLSSAGVPVGLRFQQTRDEYLKQVQRIRDYIAAGDVYQVNYAQSLSLEVTRDAATVYRNLRASNPAPYGALLRWPDAAVASVSPELFLAVRGDQVLTRPIKGTRPRGADPQADAAQRRALLGSGKDAAELAMIVDLHRNDLGRVCRPGSVRVVHPRLLETHPTVHHTVAEIAGRLQPDRDALDALRACFPAGSISGVPKIRALQIIHELEPAARGVYTGAIGVLGLDGGATFNVAIRTLQIRGNTATLHAGGGIVADSDPIAEYHESIAKMRGILRGLGVEAAIGKAPE